MAWCPDNSDPDAEGFFRNPRNLVIYLCEKCREEKMEYV
jgi:hypothetical protein